MDTYAADHRSRPAGRRRAVALLAACAAAVAIIPWGGGVALGFTQEPEIVGLPITTATWPPPARTDLSGVTSLAATQLLVVDTNVPNTGWRYDYTNEPATVTAYNHGIEEPTGVEFVPTLDGGTLFVTDDTNDVIHVIPNSGSRREIELDPMVIDDPEDPAYDSINGVLYFLNGAFGQLHKVDPVDGIFGNENDIVTQVDDFLDLDDSERADWEGLAFDSETGHLLVGAKHDPIVYEIDPANGFVEVDSVDVGDWVDTIGGMAIAPSSFDPSVRSLWIVDRAPDTLVEFALGDVPQFAPVAIDMTVQVQFQTATQITLQATDKNVGDTLTYTIVDQPDHGTISPLSGTNPVRTYTPAPGYSGPDSFTFVVNDGTADSNVATVTIQVQAVNTPPVLTVPASVSVVEGELLQFTATATDAGPVTFRLVGSKPAGAAMTSGGKFTWTPTEAQGPGNYVVNVEAKDSGGLTAVKSVQIRVEESNRPPVVTSPGNRTNRVGDTVSVTLSAKDPDLPANSLTWTAVGLPPGLSVSGGKIVGTIASSAAQGSPYTVTVTATDNGTPKLSGQATFTWTVTQGPGEPGDPGGPSGPDVSFLDTAGHVFAADIDWLASSGITKGCNPPANNRFCPDDFVTRGQMAAFLVRALGYTDTGSGNLFVDDDGHVFEADIARLATAGVTRGCNPPANNRFCPDDFVTRGQMAAFLRRALGD